MISARSDRYVENAGPVSWTLEYVSDWFATPKIFEEFDNDDGDEIISG